MPTSHSSRRLRLAVSGPHSTGKTTIATSLAHRWKDAGVSVHVIRGVARKLINQGVALGKDADLASYYRLVTAQLAEQRTAPSAEVLISDRTVLDALAYSIANRRNCVDKTGTSELAINFLKEVATLELCRYDAQLITAAEFPMEPDSIRPPGTEYQLSIDAVFKELARELALPVLRLQGSAEDRISSVVAFLYSQGFSDLADGLAGR